MSNQLTLTIVGNLTGDPELRFIQSGAAVVNFTIAYTPSSYDKATSAYKDGETLFMRCSLWRDAAENVAESLVKGTRVIATGALVSRSWEKDGQKQTAMEMQVDEIGPSLRYATAQVTKKGSSTVAAARGGFAPAASAEPSDPWASAEAPF